MPGDAKLGLVIGVGMVILVAVLFRREGTLLPRPVPRSAPVSTPIGAPDPGEAEIPAPPADRPLVLEPTSLSLVESPQQRANAVRLHRVEEGETLFSVALRYYGDGSRSADLFHANRQQLMAPDRLRPGTVLRVPELPEREAARP
jgi:nucleoid-associated protein YgaU